METKTTKAVQKDAIAKIIKLKAIAVTNKKKDGSTYKVLKTIVTTPDGEKWIPLVFGEDVNDKKLLNGNWVLSARDCDITMPSSFEPYEKDGKKKYPYIYIKDIIDYVPLKTKAPEKPNAVQSMFSITDEDIYTPDDINPFEK